MDDPEFQFGIVREKELRFDWVVVCGSDIFLTWSAFYDLLSNDLEGKGLPRMSVRKIMMFDMFNGSDMLDVFSSVFRTVRKSRKEKEELGGER